MRSFESEIAEQRRVLYVELGLHKESQNRLLISCDSLERTHNSDTGALDNRIKDLESELKIVKERLKVDGDEKVGKSSASELSKEVITALVTEVILAEALDRRGRETQDIVDAVSKRQGYVSALNDEAEKRMAVQIDAMKSSFMAEMATMAQRMKEATDSMGKKAEQSTFDNSQWRVKYEEKVEEMKRVSADQEKIQSAVTRQLRLDLTSKSEELATALAILRAKEIQASAAVAASTVQADLSSLQQTVETFMRNHNEELNAQRLAEADNTALNNLQVEVTKVGSKVSDTQTALAKVNVRSMHIQDEVKAANDAAKEAKSLVAELAVSLEKLEKADIPSAPPAPQQVSGDQFKLLESKVDAVIVTVTESVTAAMKEGEGSSVKIALDVAELHRRLTDELQALRLILADKDGGRKNDDSRERYDEINSSISLQAEDMKRSSTMSPIHLYFYSYSSSPGLLATSCNLHFFSFHYIYVRLICRIELSLTALEDGLDVLHGEVVLQGQQGAILHSKVLNTENRCKKKYFLS